MTGMKLKIKQIVIISMVLVCAVLFSACMRSDAGIDPGDWGYGCCVTYDALGGIINSCLLYTSRCRKGRYNKECKRPRQSACRVRAHGAGSFSHP